MNSFARPASLPADQGEFIPLSSDRGLASIEQRLPSETSFTNFSREKAAILAAQPRVLDLTETNVVRALSRIRPDPVALDLPERTHRCHLAEFWLDLFALPTSWKPRVLVSQGVRHSLRLLFTVYAASGLRVLLPDHVYPVYADIANTARLSWQTYPTLPRLAFRGLEDADVLLLCHPVKPLGAFLSSNELASIKAWLIGDRRRRVLIDAVYTFGTSFEPSTLELIGTGQAILLHSLSKGWVHPNIAGVALVADADIEQLTPVFRRSPPPGENLRLAHALLTQAGDFPDALQAELAFAEERLCDVLAQRGVAMPGAQGCPPRYLFVLQTDWRELLDRHGVLALPASVFGSPLPWHSVVSSLPLTVGVGGSVLRLDSRVPA